MDDASPFLRLVDPELRAAALQVREASLRFTPMSSDRLQERRATMAAAAALLPRDPGVPVREQLIPGPAGDLRLYLVNEAQGRGPRPAILHMHGGGFTASTAGASVPHLQRIASALDCLVVSVDFRNAPETSFEGSMEDDYAGLLWLHRNAEALGADPARIALLGESGGGGHAALLAFTARDRGDAPVMFQALIYPMIDDRTGSSRPTPPHLGTFNWNADANRFGWRAFLGREPGTDATPAVAVPARRTDLAGLPPTFIGVGALDIFVEENVDYARRLLAAGVPTELVVAPGAFHGFDMIAPDASVSRRFADARIGALRRAFASVS